jgi:asparagine synthase (glutamine-hydrolysing)
MCGIVGFNYEDKSFLRKALNEIKHRGPDNFGTFTNKKISLGHRRLSIIDLSKSGNQPMSNEDGTIYLIFNGEIYNFKELKNNLKNKHDFKSNTDTEVLIHLYEEEGIGMLKKLQGMFTFCIYDSKKQTLFLARDRIGIKPLYYYNLNKKFIFCSEIKGILQNQEISRQVNLESLSSFLVFRANTQEQTLFNSIKKLMPGHFLIYDLKTNILKKEKYWDLKYLVQNKSKSYFLSQLKFLLNDSVKRRLMSDVPYGAYLSGGVDSGTIVSLMSRYSQQPVKTFSVGFEEEDKPETNNARFLAENLNTNHHELLISQNSVKYFPKIIYQADEPIADPTIIPIYLLSKYAKKYSTVILTGEGADELFAGYPQYKFMKINNRLVKPLPKIIKKQIPKTINKIPKSLLNKGFKFASLLGDKGIERFSNFINTDIHSQQYLNQVSIFNEKEQTELLNKKIILYKKYNSYFQNSNFRTLITNCQKLDFKEPMVEDLLMKVDKNTMAFSIEGRVPFLDHRIVELVSQMPENLKLKGFIKDKHILRKCVKNLIPTQTRKRKKRHFFVPIDNWFKEELSSLKKDLLSKTYINKQKIFNYSYLKKINQGFNKSKLFYSRQLWALISFQIWYKKYIENEDIKI